MSTFPAQSLSCNYFRSTESMDLTSVPQVHESDWQRIFPIFLSQGSIHPSVQYHARLSDSFVMTCDTRVRSLLSPEWKINSFDLFTVKRVGTSDMPKTYSSHLFVPPNGMESSPPQIANHKRSCRTKCHCGHFTPPRDKTRDSNPNFLLMCIIKLSIQSPNDFMDFSR
jgi:hypothetical protein